VRLTEGELKADAAFFITGVPTISAPGVSNWRACLLVLKELGCRTVRLALDGDAKDKPTVARALGACAQTLATEGYAIELERWPEEHKGIDDALAAGANVEVLTGDAAQQAIAEIVAEGTAGEPPQEPGPLDRLAEVLADGPETFFRDRELLRALAQLAETDAAEYACRRAQSSRAGVRLLDLDRAIAPFRQEARAQQPPPSAAGPYRISAGRIVRASRGPDGGDVEIALCNFTARIVEGVTRDNGAEQSTAFAIEGTLWDGRPLPRATVSAAEFPRLDWVTGAWQGRAVVYAGQGARDHLPCAIELLSPDRAERVEYAHTGWREIEGRNYYLHAGGAIGPDGQAAGVAVALPDALSRFELPALPQGQALVEAIRASLRLLELGRAPLMFSLAGAVYRSVLGPSDFSLHACGPTGVFKSETAALFQQHFGAGLDSRHLPGSWSSTGNALEALGFAAKDAVLVVDDFAPSGSISDVQRFHREADRVLRAQGNSAGRQRLRSDSTLRTGKPPRGLILSTGEDVPRGQSLRARLLVLEFSPGDIDTGRLTPCQKDASAGLYAGALAGYLRWLASRYAHVQRGLRSEVAELRDKALALTAHARTPGIVADLAAGWKHFLAFAVEVGAITPEESRVLFERAWQALGEAAAGQVEHVAAAEPVGQFLRLLSGALASGRAHVAGPDGNAPVEPAPWGWCEVEGGVGQYGRRDYRAQGRRIGWIDGEDLYLEPEAAYAEAQELAKSQGDSLTVSARTLHKRLKERGLLVTTEQGKLLTRRTLEGRRRCVVHLAASVLSEKQGEPGESGENPEKPGTSCPFPSPSSNGRGPKQGEQQGEETAEKPDSATIPPIPPVPGAVPGREVIEL